jgi:hypothetical protein
MRSMVEGCGGAAAADAADASTAFGGPPPRAGEVLEEHDRHAGAPSLRAS